MKLKSGHKIVPLGDKEMEKQRRDFEAYTFELVRLMPGRWLFSSLYENVGDEIYGFQHKASDVVIMTWPKCGSTWAQEIIWNMRNNPNLDNPEAASEHVLLRSPMIEFDMFMGFPTAEEFAKENDVLFETFSKFCKGKDPKDGIYLQLAECIPEPRTIKTHLPFSLMSPSMLDKCKVVYVARNPKDVIVSFYHQSILLRVHDYVGSFAEFLKYFVDDDLLCGPYWLHLKEAWEKRDHPNLLFLFYEDIKANPWKEIKKIDAFIGTHLTEEQINGIIKYTSFGEMKKRNNIPLLDKTIEGVKVELINKDVLEEEGGFFRRGESGGWKSKITPDLEAKVDDWIKMHLDPIGLHFKYEV